MFRNCPPVFCSKIRENIIYTLGNLREKDAVRLEGRGGFRTLAVAAEIPKYGELEALILGRIGN